MTSSLFALISQRLPHTAQSLSVGSAARCEQRWGFGLIAVLWCLYFNDFRSLTWSLIGKVLHTSGSNYHHKRERVIWKSIFLSFPFVFIVSRPLLFLFIWPVHLLSYYLWLSSRAFLCVSVRYSDGAVIPQCLHWENLFLLSVSPLSVLLFSSMELHRHLKRWVIEGRTRAITFLQWGKCGQNHRKWNSLYNAEF